MSSTPLNMEKILKGGLKADELEKPSKDIGFKKVDFFYHWFIGQGKLINDEPTQRGSIPLCRDNQSVFAEGFTPFKESF